MTGWIHEWGVYYLIFIGACSWNLMYHSAQEKRKQPRQLHQRNNWLEKQGVCLILCLVVKLRKSCGTWSFYSNLKGIVNSFSCLLLVLDYWIIINGSCNLMNEWQLQNVSMLSLVGSSLTWTYKIWFLLAL